MTQSGNGKNKENVVEETADVSVPDPFGPQMPPLPAADVPDGLPSDSDFRASDMSGTENGKVLIVGDRAREAAVARARAEEDTRQRESLETALRAGMAAEPDIDEEEADLRLAMEPYWNLVPEIQRPEGEWAFLLQDNAADALKLAFSILDESNNSGILKTASLALFGGYRQVSLERFGNILGIVRDLQKQADAIEAEASRKCDAELERLLSNLPQAATTGDPIPPLPDESTRGEARSGFRESARFPYPVSQDSDAPSDPAGHSVEWDVNDALGSDPRRDSTPARADDSPVTPIRRKIERKLTALPAWEDQDEETQEKPEKEKRTSPRLVYAILALILTAIMFSIAYLFSAQKTSTEIQAVVDASQDEWNLEQEETITRHDEALGRLTTGLADKDKKIISLEDERNSLQVITDESKRTIGENTRVMEKLLKDNRETRTELDRLTPRIEFLEAELERRRSADAEERDK